MTEEMNSGVELAVEESNQPEQEQIPLEVEGAPEQEGQIVQEEKEAEGEVPKKPSGAQRNKAKIARLERELAEMQEKLQKTSAPVEDKEPNIDDFDTYDAYNRAAARWEASQVLKAHEMKIIREKEEAKLKEVANNWDAKIDSLDDPDEYYDMVERYKNYPVKKVIIEAARESDVGPQILLHLGKNPELFDELNKKSDLSIIRELSKIEALVSQKPSVRVSKAPAPINPVKRSTPAVAGLDGMDTDAYMSKRYPHLYKK